MKPLGNAPSVAHPQMPMIALPLSPLASQRAFRALCAPLSVLHQTSFPWQALAALCTGSDCLSYFQFGIRRRAESPRFPNRGGIH